MRKDKGCPQIVLSGHPFIRVFMDGRGPYLTPIFPGLPFACRVDLTAYQTNGKTKRKDLTRNRVTETRTMVQSLWFLELAGFSALRAEEVAKMN